MAALTAITIGLAVASGVANAVGQAEAASAQEEANKASQGLIVRNQALQIQSLQNQEDEDVKKATEAQFDQQREENAAIAKARVSAGESGVAGLSVDALLNDLNFQGNENSFDIAENLDFKKRQRQLEVDGIGITSESQINQLPAVQSPDYLGIALNTGAQAFGAYQSGNISGGGNLGYDPSVSAPPKKPTSF
jgi:hypothetical protein